MYVHNYIRTIIKDEKSLVYKKNYALLYLQTWVCVGHKISVMRRVEARLDSYQGMTACCVFVSNDVLLTVW